jgi:CDP-L-myo-inositol myo-inositolphosphotransferase
MEKEGRTAAGAWETPMKCLILAAGRGRRLSALGEPKPLVPLLGLSLIERVILTAEKSGLTEFWVVTGYRGEAVRRSLERFRQERRLRITCLTNEEWERGNGVSVLRAKERLHENFVLLMGDHLFDGEILERLRNERIADGEVLLAVDPDIGAEKGGERDEATRVLVEGGRILDIGKEIQEYNAYDTGIFLCSPSIFNAIEESLHRGGGSLSGGIRVLAGRGKARAWEIGRGYWIDVDDVRAFKKAEAWLLAGLTKPSDGPVSRYLNRPLSTRITKRLLKTGVTPNQISFLSFLLAMLGTLFFFLGEYAHLAIGATLAQVSSIVDGSDGEIARLKFQTTEFGGWFDAVLDRYADASLLFGLTYYVYAVDRGPLVLLIGFLAIVGAFMNSYTADKYDGFMRRRLGPKKAYFRMGRDVRIFLLFLGGLLNRPLWVLLALALLMNTETVRRVMVLHGGGQDPLR